MKLHIDIETYSDLDLTEVGVYKYASHPSFKILLFAYAFNGDEVDIVDLEVGEELSNIIFNALFDPQILKIAHNASFEFICLQAFYGVELDWKQWQCTMIKAAYLGLPLQLGRVAKVLNLSEQKEVRGKALITYFCMPVKTPKKKDDFRTVNRHTDAPEMWQEFKGYNIQDVRTEIAIDDYCDRFEALPPHEWAYWQLDQAINGAGILADRTFIQSAIRLNSDFLEGVYSEMKQLTGIDNPNSLTQLKTWLESQLGYAVPSLSKEFLADSKSLDLPKNVKRLIELRRLSSKASISKYDKMLGYMQDDDRIRGLFQFYGANRTGREAGRGVQPQNLKKTFSNSGQVSSLAKRLNVSEETAREYIGDALETAKEAVRTGVAPILYDDVPEVISKLVRTAFIAPKNKAFCVSDFAAIEARVLAWLAGENWVLDVFRTHGKIYEATASKMFNVPFESITKGSDMRAKGKVASLALGYQGASGALITMGALREGLTEEELPAIVQGYRQANPNIVKLWRNVEQIAKHVVERKKSHTLKLPYTELQFSFEKGYLFIRLPSGRRLAYYGATVDKGKLTYYGLDQVKKVWHKIDTYGGMLVENLTQAIARDILFHALFGMKELNIVMHVHDEIVVEEWQDKASQTLEFMELVMSRSPLWCNELPLKGDGFISKFYKKD